MNRVTVKPKQRGGRPCVRGMRIRVKDVSDILANGRPSPKSQPTWSPKTSGPGSPTPPIVTIPPFSNLSDRSWASRFDGAQSNEERATLENTPLQWTEPGIHVDAPFSSKRAWEIACEIIDVAARQSLKELNLGREMDRGAYMALNPLPGTIGDLKNLRRLVLYGSNISSLPREIAGWVNLRLFEPYTSYRLHWYPFELTRCKNLKSSCVSTRALYGNYKLRPPFPDLSRSSWKWLSGISCCSICNTPTNRP